MKNKDKYKDNNAKAIQQFKINGCGKTIQSSREVVILVNDKEVERIKTQEDVLDVFLKWLDSEEKPLK